MGPWGKTERAAASLPLGANDFRVYIALSSYANKNRQCWPTVEQLSQDTNLPERSVQRATSNLERARVIAKVPGRGRGRPNIYILLDLDAGKGVMGDTHYPVQKREKGCHSPSPFSAPESEHKSSERVSPTGGAIEQTKVKGSLGQEGMEKGEVIQFPELRKVGGASW